MFDSLLIFDLLPFVVLLIGAGSLAGIIAGLLGVGGGTVIVPVLFQTLLAINIDPAICMHLAIGTSLCLMVTTGFSSARAHHIRDGIDKSVIIEWGPWVIFGVFIGSFLADMSHSAVLNIIFAVVTILAAIRLVTPEQKSHSKPFLMDTPWRQCLPIVIGGISTMMGIGGGSMTVPALTIYGFPANRAVATSSVIGLFIAIPGSIMFAINGLNHPSLPIGSVGYIYVPAFFIMLPVSAALAPLGARLAHIIDGSLLKRGFAVFLAIVSVQMAWSAFAHW